MFAVSPTRSTRSNASPSPTSGTAPSSMVVRERSSRSTASVQEVVIAPNVVERRRARLGQTRGVLGHLGVNVPDLAAAKAYYGELMPLLDFELFLDAADEVAFMPAGGKRGTYLFLYPATETGDYSRQHAGLQHLAFMVQLAIGGAPCARSGGRARERSAVHTAGIPAVPAALLRDVLARPVRLHARSRVPLRPRLTGTGHPCSASGQASTVRGRCRNGSMPTSASSAPATPGSPRPAGCARPGDRSSCSRRATASAAGSGPSTSPTARRSTAAARGSRRITTGSSRSPARSASRPTRRG